MNNLAHALYKRRIERGALELDIPEAEIRVDENGKPVEIRFRERGESEKLIEEFMLQANEAVAEYMCKRELPTVYRVHENPDPDKLRVFASVCASVRLPYRPVQAGGYGAVPDRAARRKERPEAARAADASAALAGACPLRG